MLEQSKPNLPLYGIIVRNIPILAIGFRKITGSDLNEIMDDRLRSLISTYFKTVEITRPEEKDAKYQLEIGFMGKRYPILPKIKIEKTV